MDPVRTLKNNKNQDDISSCRPISSFIGLCRIHKVIEKEVDAPSTDRLVLTKKNQETRPENLHQTMCIYDVPYLKCFIKHVVVTSLLLIKFILIYSSKKPVSMSTCLYFTIKWERCCT